MGWGDQHKYQWMSAHHTSSISPDRYIIREVIECKAVCAEDEVGLDEVLVEVGDHVRYEYNAVARRCHVFALEDIVDGPRQIASLPRRREGECVGTVADVNSQFWCFGMSRRT